MESRNDPNDGPNQTPSLSFGQASPTGGVRRLLLAVAWSLLAIGLMGLLGWLTGLRPLLSILPQYAPIALYAAAFFVAASGILLWHANRAWSSLSFSTAVAASVVISVTGLLGVASYLTGIELTLESLIVPTHELYLGRPLGHISPVGGVLFALLAPAVWLGLHPSASARSRQVAAFIALCIASTGSTMTIGYLMGAPLLYGGAIIPVSFLSALGFTVLGSALTAAAGDDLVPLRFLTGDSLRARLLRLFLPLSVSLTVVQATAHATIEANAADPAVPTALWTIGFLLIAGGVVVYAARAVGNDYDRAQMELRQTERTLRETRDYLENLLDCANAPIVVWDPSQCITRFNHAFEQLTRRTDREVIGEHLDLLFPPDERRSQAIQLVTRATVGERLEVVEIPILRADGQVRTVLWNSATVLADDGITPVATIAQGQDITERKRAEQALSESIERLNMAQDAAHAGTWDWDVQTGQIIWSRQQYELFGVDPLMITASFETWRSVLHPDDMEIAGLRIDEALRDHSRLDSDYRVVLPDGRTRWISSVGEGQYDDQGRPVRMIGICMDITERKRAEGEIQKVNAELEQRVAQRTAQLELTNSELEAFAYSISHDLRAPLRGIDGWSQALWEDYGDHLDIQAQTYIDRVRSETQRMGQLIDDILQLSRLTRSEMRMERVDLTALAQTIAARLRESAPERSVEFVIEAGLAARGDARLLEIALSNLLGNAFKFTARTSQARIEFGQIEAQGQRILFVRDNGAGFDMAYSKKLFGAFQRMHKTSDFPGTGIGLATVQRVVHRHGGRIWAEAAVDQGATFYFTI